MKIAILGYGEQGRAAVEYWQKPVNEITVCDVNTELVLPDGVRSQLGKNYLSELSNFDLIVRSPSVYPKDIVTANSPVILEKVTTVTNEFFKVCPSKNIIGVTGTKGKGTTSTLITKMLEAAGKTVHLGGNIGIPPLDMLKAGIKADDWVVLELANFQLIDLKYSPHIAVCLMVEPEHLNWHENMDDYLQAKQQLFRWQKADDIAVYHAENANSQKVTDVSKGKRIPYLQTPGAMVVDHDIVINEHVILHTDELKLLGKHNWENVCAAVTAVWQITQDVPAIQSVLTTFTGLEHRLELVREVNNVKYYDDSFGTTPETAMVAIEAFEQPKVVILGGSDKGASYDKLAEVVATNDVRAVVVIGETGPAIIDALKRAGFSNIIPGGKTMPEIVHTAQAHAEAGDIVLLSTACASFDLFKNYKVRGEQFKAAVQALA